MKKALAGVYVLVGLQLVAMGLLVHTVYFPSEDRLKTLHYGSETATLVSPHSLREELAHGEQKYVLVDTRDRESYERGHIITAINVEPGPQMVEKFRMLQEENSGKEILIYCYTEVCMRGRKVGNELAKHGIHVRELGIGFNEWKNFWREWNYENEWEGIVMDEFIAIGSDPGELRKRDVAELLDSDCGLQPGFSC